MDCQNFAVSWGRNFVGNWFEALQSKTIHYSVKCSWGRKFMGKGTPRNPRTSNFHKFMFDNTGILIHFYYTGVILNRF